MLCRGMLHEHKVRLSKNVKKEMCSLIKGIKVAYLFIHGPILIKSKSKGHQDIILKHPMVMNFSRLRIENFT